MIGSVALLDDEVVARQPERRAIIELEVRLHLRWRFPGSRHPANDERQITKPNRSVQLALQPRIFAARYALLTNETAAWSLA